MNKNNFRFWNDMNKKQYETLQKFKEKILTEKLLEDLSQFDDLYLLRFLRARKFELEKVYLMFENFIKWRKQNDVDTIDVR